MIRFRARRWGQEELAQRLCQVIYGQERSWKEASGRWCLGSANNWWLHPKENKEYILHYRYAHPTRMKALADVLAWLLHLEILEVS